jgi:ribonuclease-3
MSDALTTLEVRIGHAFQNRALLEQALRHTSYIADHPLAGESNQRLEFLGDAVLQIFTAEELFRAFQTEREGVLSKRRALLVNRTFLAQLSNEIQLPPLLVLGQSEESTGGRLRVSNLADAFEALIGAVYLDSDLVRTGAVLRKIYGNLQQRLSGIEEADNPKGKLQEMVHPLHGNNALRYEVIRTLGEDHAREYEVAVYLLERELGTGRGSSKKVAEEAAARAALLVLPKPE